VYALPAFAALVSGENPVSLIALLTPAANSSAVGVSANRLHGCERFHRQHLLSLPGMSRVECPHNP
jgi:hypothetical protein